MVEKQPSTSRLTPFSVGARAIYCKTVLACCAVRGEEPCPANAEKLLDVRLMNAVVIRRGEGVQRNVDAILPVALSHEKIELIA